MMTPTIRKTIKMYTDNGWVLETISNDDVIVLKKGDDVLLIDGELPSRTVVIDNLCKDITISDEDSDVGEASLPFRIFRHIGEYIDE